MGEGVLKIVFCLLLPSVTHAAQQAGSEKPLPAGPDPQKTCTLPRYMAFVITVSLALSQSQQHVEVRRAGGSGGSQPGGVGVPPTRGKEGYGYVSMVTPGGACGDTGEFGWSHPRTIQELGGPCPLALGQCLHRQ